MPIGEPRSPRYENSIDTYYGAGAGDQRVLIAGADDGQSAGAAVDRGVAGADGDGAGSAAERRLRTFVGDVHVYSGEDGGRIWAGTVSSHS